MGYVKNAFYDEIIAAQDDQRADEFDCYEARLHSLLSELDWFIDGHHDPKCPLKSRDGWAALHAMRLQDRIKRMMK